MRQHPSSHLKQMAEKDAGAPKLDLFNFDSPNNQSSRYILTSPRSLQACSRLGIKPIQLLPKTIQEFSQTIPGLSGSRGEAALKTVYEEFEKQRRAKLQAARREREKIIAELESSSQPSQVKTSRSSWRTDLMSSGKTGAPSRVDTSAGGEDKSSQFVRNAAMLKEKDHRILDAMESRFASEKKAALLGEAIKLQWDLQKKKEQLDKEHKRTQHQRDLNQSQQQFRQQLSDLKSLQNALDNEEKLHLLSYLQTKWDRWNTSAELQAKARSQRIEEKRSMEEKKKRLQEQRLCELETERRLTKEAAAEYWRQQESRVEENRSMRSTNESMERQLKRGAAEKRHKQNMAELEEEVQTQTEALRSYLAEKDSLAQQRYLTQKQHREAVIQQASESRTQRALRVKETTQEIDSRLEEWRVEVDARYQQSMAQAERMSQRLIEERRQRAHTERVKWKKVHSERMDQLLAEEREKRLQYAEEIKMKTERSESIARERCSFLEKSRQAAHTSATLRQQVKDRYLRNSFDRMALEAELLASLERKHSQKPAQTQSKTILG